MKSVADPVIFSDRPLVGGADRVLESECQARSYARRLRLHRPRLRRRVLLVLLALLSRGVPLVDHPHKRTGGLLISVSTGTVLGSSRYSFSLLTSLA